MAVSGRSPPGRARTSTLLTAPHRQLISYAAARLLVETLISIRGIVLAQVLGAALFGTWTLFRLLLTYGSLAGLGYHLALEKRVSAAQPDGAERRADARTGLGFALTVFSGVSLLAVAVAAVSEQGGVRSALLAVAACLLIERIWWYGITYLRATGAFRRFATIELASAALSVVLVWVLAALMGLPGAVLGFLMAHLIGLLGMVRFVPFRPSLKLARLAGLIQISAPLCLAQLLSMLMSSIDRLVLLAYTDFATLGLYAFATAVGNLAAAFGGVVRTLVFPRLYAHAAQVGARVSTAEHLRQTVLPFVWLTAPLTALAATIVPVGIGLVAPGFSAAAAAAAILLLGGVAGGAHQLMVLGVVAAGRQSRTPWLTGAGCTLSLGASVVLIEAGYGLAALASATVGVRIVHLTALIGLLDLDLRTRLLTMLAVALPLVWCAVLTRSVAAFLPAADAVGAGQALLLTAVGLLPLVGCAWSLRKHSSLAIRH